MKEVATLFKTTQQQVRNMIRSGELEAIKIGREYRITLETVAGFLDGA